MHSTVADFVNIHCHNIHFVFYVKHLAVMALFTPKENMRLKKDKKGFSVLPAEFKLKHKKLSSTVLQYKT